MNDDPTTSEATAWKPATPALDAVGVSWVQYRVADHPPLTERRPSRDHHAASHVIEIDGDLVDLSQFEVRGMKGHRGP